VVGALPVVVEDGGEVGLGEPAVHGGVPERPVDLVGGEQLGQLDRGGHLEAHLGGADAGCFVQPQRGPLPEGEELGLRGGPRARGPFQGAFGGVGEVAVVEFRGAGGCPMVTGDLDGSVRADVGDDDLFVGAAAVGADPHRLPAQGVGDGVLAGLEGHHRRVRRHDPSHAERDGVRGLRDRVQPQLLFGEHVHRSPSGDPVRAAVHQLAERLTRSFQVGERVIGCQQVRLGGHQVGLGELHRRLGAALRGGVRRHTRVHRHRVVAGEPHQLRVADREAGDVFSGDGLLGACQDFCVSGLSYFVRFIGVG
jgi:hypothetical protein